MLFLLSPAKSLDYDTPTPPEVIEITLPSVNLVEREGEKPWRVEGAEAELPRGAKPAMAAILDGARPTPDNAFKVTLAERALASVLAGIDGQNTAFLTGEQQMAEETGTAYAGAAFDAARFSSTR